jgi:sugar O-acyltransferase (sialic acid O-acetyltransferase NeuD family)
MATANTVTVVGAGGLASEVTAYLQRAGILVLALLDREPGPPIHGVPVVAQVPDGTPLVHGIGDGRVRQRLQDQGGNWFTFTCNSFTGPRCHVDVGTVICPGVILTADVTVGRGGLVNLAATLGHGTTAGDWLTVHPGANISGNVTLGNHVTVGSNATILPDLSICDDVTLGAGTVVTRSILEPGTYVGVPARKL